MVGADFHKSHRPDPLNERTFAFPWTSKPRYMSPEQARGERAIAASDVFALGLVLYEMLTGEPAVSGSSILDVIKRIKRFDAAKHVAKVPEPFAGILRESLVLSPMERRLTMTQIAERLGFIALQPPGDSPATNIRPLLTQALGRL